MAKRGERRTPSSEPSSAAASRSVKTFARLAACTDLDLLDALFDRAFEVARAEDLFER